MTDFIKLVAHHVAIIAEGIAVLFIIVGIIGAVIIYLKKTLFLK